MLKSAVVAFVLGSVLLSRCLAQGTTAVSFLLISPYAETNGMGEASVALVTNDPLASLTNPAQLGMQAQSSQFSFGYNRCNYSDEVWLMTLAANAGFRWQQLNEKAPPLSFGFGYSRVLLDLGTFLVTGPGGPTPIATFDARESSDQFTVGVGFDEWVRASLGLTYKHVVSNLSPVATEQEAGSASAKADLFDYGALLDVPLVSIFSGITGDSLSIGPSVSPFVDWSIGTSRSNLGREKMVYIDAAQADPLPRYARAGMALNIGLMYSKDHVCWRPVSFTWSIEAGDLLVNRAQYQDGLGDIHFFDEVIMGHTNKETTKRKGWELNLLDMVYIRGGRREQDPSLGTVNYSTSGWGLRLRGLLNGLQVFNGAFEDEGVMAFILNQIDVGYNHSQYTMDGVSSSTFSNDFNSVNLSISN